MYGGDEVSAVVMEIGSSSTKCGYAGEDTPKFVLPSAVGVMGGEASSTDKAKKQYFVGSNAMAVRRDGMRVESPMTDGIVTDWDAAEASRWARVELEDEERRRAQEEREEEREHRAAARKERKRERRAAEKAERERGRVASAKERWAAHEARWATLEADPPGGGGDAGSAGPLRYDDVPWPPKMTAMLRAACGDGGEGERKAAYRRLIRRWHPDKFGARFGERVRAGGEEARVMERVNAVARALNQEFAGRA